MFESSSEPGRWDAWRGVDTATLAADLAQLDWPTEADVDPEHAPAPIWAGSDADAGRADVPGDGGQRDNAESGPHSESNGWLDRLVAADPEQRPVPTAAQVVAEAEHAPVTGRLVCRLAQVDPASLDADGQVGLAVAWSRVRNSADARVVDAVARLAAGGDGADPWDPASFTWAEVGAALRLGDGAATGLVHTARTLTGDLPATLEAMRAGQLTRQKADVIVELTAGLTPEQRSEVEQATLTKAADRTPAQHRAAVRRQVDRIDPDALDRRRAKARADIRLVRAHLGDGMGELFAAMPSEDLDIIWEAADAWARREKADGHPDTLDQLRVAAIVRWAESFLTHGDPTTCDTHCTLPDTTTVDSQCQAAPGSDATAAPVGAGCRPRRHGRPVVLNLLWDLPSYLGLTDNPGMSLASGASIPAAVLRDLAADNAEVRRLLYDPTTGHLRDATPDTYRPTAMLSAFLALRDVCPTTPTGSPTPATSGDLDHVINHADGGPTTAENLHSPTRRWHRAKTFQHWTVTTNPDGTWTWTSTRTHRSYTSRPFDYRLGP